MQTIKDSELRYRRLFEAAQDGILILDAETGMIEDVNPYLMKMLGYSREEFVEKKLWEVGAFRDIEASKDAFEALQQNKYIRYEDLPLKTKDGRLIQVEFVSNVYSVDNKKVIQCNIRDITEHRRIIAALQRNEKTYHDLINQSPDGYFIIELSGNILTVNEAMCKELEFSEEEILSMNIWEIIPEQYLDQYKEKLTKVLRGESLKEATEYVVRGKAGKNHYVEVLSAPRFSGKDIVGFQGIARDITARRQAEEALQESEAKFRRLVTHLPTVLYVNAVGDASSTLYVSPQIETLLGYTPQEWMADPKLWSKTLHPEDRQHVLKQAAHTDQTNKPFEMEYRMIARDGRLVWVHDQVILVNDLEGQPQFWQGIMLDITERKQVEGARDELARIVDASQDAILGKTLDGIITSWNGGAERVYGYSAEEAIGQSISLIIPPDRSNELSGILDSIQQGKHIEHFDTVRVRKDGRRIHMSITVSPIMDSIGNIVGASTIARDITERKQAEVEIRKLNAELERRVEERTAELERAIHTKDEFLANMSHELRTPLNAILGLSESLEEQIAGPLNDKQQKYVATVRENGYHLLSLINDILDLAKIEAGQISLDINKVNIHSVCQSSIRMINQLAQKKNQDVTLEIDDIGLIWADERRLKQMIVNLLSNAVKFTPEDGKFGLQVHKDQDENRVTITVWDNGVGIQESDLSRLFQPFTQLDSSPARETAGTGLGLALVAQMARLHGGSVNAVSQPGKGSRFTIVLPWEHALAVDTVERMKITGKFRAVNPTAENKRTILLIEDTREVVMMVTDYLEFAGYKIITAQDGLEGIARAKLAKPNLILMDVQMPNMDGLEAMRRLRADPDSQAVPIIALTARAMPGDRERCLAAGANDYLTKPVSLKRLAKVIDAHLAG